MGVGLMCAECGRLIPATELAWFKVDGRCVCWQCAEAELTKLRSDELGPKQ